MAENIKHQEETKMQTRPPMMGRPGGGPGGPRNIVREKPKNTLGTLKKLFKYIGKSKLLIVLLLLTTVAVTVFSLAAPFFQGKAIDSITISESRLQVDLGELRTCLFAMGVIYIASAAVQLAQGLISAQISQTTVYTLRRDLFRKIEHLPVRYTDTHKHGDLMSRMTNDVDNISNTISQSISSLFSGVLTLVGALVMMLYYSWIMTLIAMITIPLTVLVSTTLTKFMRKYFIERQKLLGEINGQIEEMCTGFKTVVAYGKEKDASDNFARASNELRKCGIKANVWGGIMGPCHNIINNLNYLIVASFGGYFALKGTLNVGDIQAILQYSNQFSQPINTLANQYSQILTAIAGAERVFDVLDTPDETDNGKTELDMDKFRGEINFKHINFAYNPGSPVLRDFDLTVKPGQKIAIVGATGSGKTTVVNLLTRFYDVDDGEIILDGVNINDIPKKQLRAAIGIVLQDTVLFSDTIKTNIRYGKLEASDDDIRKAAGSANADVFIEKLPEKYDTVLTESGGNLSQGQRQLLSIARAVLADPKILILDEATSSVDTRTEMYIQQAMVTLMKNRTSLIIAHRLSTIRDADMIIVIKDGHIAEAGNHDALLALGGEYSKLYQNQFAGFET